jgi:hypothetical protein
MRDVLPPLGSLMWGRHWPSVPLTLTLSPKGRGEKILPLGHGGG